MKLFVAILLLSIAACSDLDQHARQAAKSMNLDMTTKLDHSADLAGPDKDKNGIRDDIDLWISKQKFSNDQAAAAKQYARTEQEIMAVKFKNREEARAMMEKNIRARGCVRFNFGSSDILSVIAQSTINTRQRLRKDSEFGSMINGMGFDILSPSMLKKEELCD